MSRYHDQLARALYHPKTPLWQCLICHQWFSRPVQICGSCMAATDPGPDWEPKTEWGRQRKAEREKRSP